MPVAITLDDETLELITSWRGGASPLTHAVAIIDNVRGAVAAQQHVEHRPAGGHPSDHRRYCSFCGHRAPGHYRPCELVRVDL